MFGDINLHSLQMAALFSLDVLCGIILCTDYGYPLHFSLDMKCFWAFGFITDDLFFVLVAF